MRKAVKPVLSGVLGLAAMALTAAPAVAGGGCCDCYGGYAGYGYAPRPPAYVYQPNVSYYQVAPRGYAAYYYAPPPPPVYYAPPAPPPAYGYAYVDRGPAVVIERGPRWRRW
jgi:hypothetical protein